MYIDSHAHLTSETLVEKADELLDRSKAAGVKRVVNICTDKRSLELGLKLAERNPMVSNAAATTPHDVDKEGESFFPLVEAAAKQNQLIAIGESGLDYFYDHSDRKTQQQFLTRYFELAAKYHLPLVIHCRDAFQDLFELADTYYAGKPAVLHCFTGTIDEAHHVIARGWHLSLSGIVTFKRSEELREVAKSVPLDRLLIETDAPYLAPVPHRGKENEPAFILDTASCIAKLRGISLDELAKATSENASQFFSFPKAI